MIAIHKISLAQYQKDRLAMPGVQVTASQIEEEYAGIVIPRRGTLVSAGYDFHTPFDFALEPGQVLVVPTGLRAVMEDDMWLGIYIRSSLGFKYGVRLVNSVAVIDADYAWADNEGHLKIGIYNGGDAAVKLKAGDAFAQGICHKYFRTYDDEPVNRRRTGGFGSTNR